MKKSTIQEKDVKRVLRCSMDFVGDVSHYAFDQRRIQVVFAPARLMKRRKIVRENSDEFNIQSVTTRLIKKIFFEKFDFNKLIPQFKATSTEFS